MYLNLRTQNEPESLHLNDYPIYNEKMRDLDLEFKMDTVQKAVSMGRSLRYQFNLKIRQPLKSLEFVTKNPDEKAVLLEMEESIREELNVKKVVFHEREDELVEYRAKANFKTLGKSLGPLMKAASVEIAKLSADIIQSILDGSTISIEVGGKNIDLDESSIIVERIEKAQLKVVNEGTLTVALDSEITEELQMEGMVRDLVRGIQNLRKESGFDVTDRIELLVHGPEPLKKAFDAFSDYIASETLATKIDWQALSMSTSIEAGDTAWEVKIEKA